MKVLFTHELFPPYVVGGGEIYCENIVKSLIKEEIDVMVVAGGWTKSKFEHYNKIPIYRVSLWPIRYSFNIKGFFALERLIKKFKPHILHANAPNSCVPASILSKFFRIPLVVSVHFLFAEEWYRYFNPFKSTLFYYLEKLVFKFHYNQLIALDRWVYYNLCKLGLQGKAVLIPHPIDTRKFKPKRKKLDTITIGTVTTLSGATKGADILLNIIKKIQAKFDVDFCIVGPYSLKQKKAFEKVGIKLIGRIPHSQIHQYFNKIDVFIGHGMSAKEAIACGCFTLLNEPTKRLLLYHKDEIENGVMHVGNHVEIISKILRRPSLLRKNIKKQVQFIEENYSMNKIIKKLVALYRTLVE